MTIGLSSREEEEEGKTHPGRPVHMNISLITVHTMSHFRILVAIIIHISGGCSSLDYYRTSQ